MGRLLCEMSKNNNKYRLNTYGLPDGVGVDYDKDACKLETGKDCVATIQFSTNDGSYEDYKNNHCIEESLLNNGYGFTMLLLFFLFIIIIIMIVTSFKGKGSGSGSSGSGTGGFGGYYF